MLPFGDIQGHDLAAPDFDQQVEVQPQPALAGWEIGSELPAPALQRGKAHTQQPGQFAGPCNISNVLVKGLQKQLKVGGSQ